jgi:predicted ATPase/class 3 adenylate cyclase
VSLGYDPSALVMGSNAVSTAAAQLHPQASRTLTFLFTDLEGSTRLWEQFPRAMKDALERHDAIMRAAVERSGGQVVKGTGDGFMAVFPSAPDGASACLSALRGLESEPWGETGALRVRMGLHTGVAETRGSDFFGPTVIRAARLMAVGHGGQVLLSAAAAALIVDELPDAATLRDLGEHRLKDLGRPERVFQLVHPGLVSDFPPLRTPSRAGNLPTQASAFVGRATELKQIDGHLGDGAVRMLTLVGPGGTGKTRLALRAAAEHADRFADGVFFVDLSAVRDTESVLTAIASAVGLNETTGESLLAELTRQLHEHRALLVLDNFEQVAAAATTVVQLLHRCPGLQLLVTSREALHVRDEHVLSVPPLSLPPADARRLSADQLTQFEAVQLFAERAQAARPDFHLSDDNAPVVAEICLRLDGLPLAIELATARINLFSPEALRERLGNRLKLLRSGARDLPARQQTLRATIEWSYRLLEPAEQRLFELLSRFSGASLEAVEVVAGGIDGFIETATDPLDGLASLLDKNLVRLADPEDGESRFVMLETIREYAAERLHDRPDLSAAAHRAHAIYFADFAQRQWQHLAGQRRAPALAAMTADTENLRTAWRYWLTEGNLDKLNELVDSLWLLYEARGWYQATIELTSDLLTVMSATPSTPERATQEITLQTSLARALLAVKGYTSEVEEAYTRALELLEANPDLPQLFPVLRGLASFYNLRAEFDKGAEIGREILRLAERQDDRSMLVDGHLVLGYNLAFLNDLRGGLEHLDQAIACFEPERQSSRRFRLGHDTGVACFTTSAFVLWMLGFPDRALERANAGVALAVELEHPFTTAYALFHCAFLHLWRREPELVRERAAGVLDIVEDHEFQIWRAVGTCLLGAAETAMGHHNDGLAQIRQGMDLYQGLKTPPVFWPLLLYVQSGACAQAGRTAEGLAHIEEALAVAGGGSGSTLLPELQLLKGDLIAAGPDDNCAGAEPCFRRAFDVARELEARTSQLRAAIRLCRLSLERGDGHQGRRLLSTVHETFTEGFTTADLIEAEELLAPG